MESYVHQRDPVVNSANFADWADGFISEIRSTHPRVEMTMIVFNGYAYHIMQKFFENFHMMVSSLSRSLRTHLTFCSLWMYRFSSHLSMRSGETLPKLLTWQEPGITQCRAVHSWCLRLQPHSAQHRGGVRKDEHLDPGRWWLFRFSLQALPFYNPIQGAKRAIPPVVEFVKQHTKLARAFVRDEEVTDCGTLRLNSTPGAHVMGKHIRFTICVEEVKRAEGQHLAYQHAKERMERRENQIRQQALVTYSKIMRVCVKARKERREAACKRAEWNAITRHAIKQHPILETFFPFSPGK